MKKAAPFILLIVMAIAILVIKKCQQKKDPTPKPRTTTTTDRKDPAANVDRDHGFDRRISYIKYSEHARCRMSCRHITQAEVEDIMQNGKINYAKSDLQNARCPRYALEGVTSDNQRVRMVFAQCDESTTVVTVIDLDTEWQCHCPGDDDKYQNRN
jgi:Domain of unknown function (DUF4258)